MIDRPVIRPYKEDDKPHVLALLLNSSLPTDDLDTDKLKNFLVAYNEHHLIVGTIGVEPYGGTGLLRSLAIHNDYRGTGLGQALTIGLELMAERLGIKNLYLLTTTATGFFTKLQYQIIHRDEAPQAIVDSHEFSHLCPTSAILLKKQL